MRVVLRVSSGRGQGWGRERKYIGGSERLSVWGEFQDSVAVSGSQLYAPTAAGGEVLAVVGTAMGFWPRGVVYG